MTAPSSPDAARLGAHPLTSACGHRRLDLTTVDASITLADGVYEVLNPSTVLAYVRIGSAVSVPSTGAAEVAGQSPVPAGGSVTLAMGAGDLHALTATGTATLEILRKVT